MSISRLCFIAHEQPDNVTLVPKPLQAYIPQWEMIRECTNSIPQAATTLEVPEEQVAAVITDGSQYGSIGRGEFSELVVKLVYKGIKDARQVPVRKRLELYSLCHTYLSRNASTYIQVTTFGDTEETSGASLTGFEPLDTLTEEGVVKGAFLNILAHSSAGKTSTMLAMASTMLTSGFARNVVYATLEMRASGVAQRAKSLTNLNNQTLLAGNVTLGQLEQYIRSDTVVFVDYADLLYVPHINEKRLQLEYIYRSLLEMSNSCALLVTASQVKQNEPEITMRSGIESASKAHVPDYIVGISNEGEVLDGSGNHLLNFRLLKNRFGRKDVQVNYHFNFKNLGYAGIASPVVSTAQEILDY